MTTRRDLFKVLAGSIAAAGAGITLATVTRDLALPDAPVKLLHARHLWQYGPITGMFDDAIFHRIDVKFVHRGEIKQWLVELMTKGEKLHPERELAPALACLNNALEDKGFEVGEIHSYSMDEWLSNKAARDAWSAI